MSLPLAFFIFTALAGFGLLVGGVFTLLGTGWALVAAAASMFMISGFIKKGLAGE
ncbi:hypothetical protein [Pseudomonas sp. UBA1879]|uniref:hypothetical protein n=1 Tax=Pseudomonas sp. UBA1879 TaxID=1947305 RepID=UPI0025FBCA07|nr:hypothetical protein [Pseudomonas sp. UBA1879]